MFSNVTYAFHGEALHGHRHHSSETLLEKTRTALQLQAPPRRRRIGLLHLPHGPNTNPNVQRKRGNKTITRFSLSLCLSGLMNIIIIIITMLLFLGQVYKVSIGAACGLSWPSDRLVIQVLDDSTDTVIKVNNCLAY